MKKQITHASFPLSMLSLAIAFAGPAHAQDGSIAQAPQIKSQQAQPAMEEIVTLGRLRDSAAQLVVERLEQEVVTDVIGAEAIGRIGDSTVGGALRRVPGVTLVDGKFVYVRGLGERYSSTFLNGAVVPSPDLTRNVIPLDIFPTSIVDSLSVQKSYSADTAAAFGGGAVNVRTKGIPDAFTYSLEVGTGADSKTAGKNVLTYKGGNDDWQGSDDGTRAMPSQIISALQTNKGEFTGLSQATQEELALSINRNIEASEKNYNPDTSFKGNIGNNFLLNNGMEIGFMAGATYKNSWKNENTVSHFDIAPEKYNELVTYKDQSTYSVTGTGNLNLGFRLNEENSISTTSLFIRNTDDETSLSNKFTSNRPLSGGRGFQEQKIRFEERTLNVNQINGEHVFGSETRELLGLQSLAFLDGIQLNWFYSDSTSKTNIPGEATVTSDLGVNPDTLQVVDTTVRTTGSTGEFRYTDLKDQVESSGWKLSYPISLFKTEIELSGGYEYSRKARSYRELQLDIGINNSNPFLSEGINSAFSDEAILDPSNDYSLNVSNNTQSYMAASTLSSSFAMVDLTYDDTWRVSAGVRYEDYKHAAPSWNPLKYDGYQLSDLENVYAEDEFYPSVSLVYMRPGFWAEDFQLRFGFSETVVRPDLREISASSYRDPITNDKIFGNPDLVTSAVKNYDMRAEWFFDDGDNLTVSLFYKDIADPIELFRAAAADETVAYEVLNAQSATISGMEMEFLKNLGSIDDSLSQFFLSGNVTIQDSELLAGSKADSPTNPKRKLNSASDYAANLQLGFDSDNGKHSAMLVYNVFGERLYYAGRLGNPDAFEQPFNSVDMTYSYYPTDTFTLKLKLKNLLDENTVIERSGVTTYEKEVGIGASLAVQYKY